MWITLNILIIWTPFVVGWSLVQFIERGVMESGISVLIIRNTYCPDRLLNEIFKSLTVPVILQTVTDDSHRNTNISRPLHLLCLQGPEEKQDLDILQNLFTSLEHFRQDKIILYSGNTFSNQSRMELLLEKCYDLRILKVVGLIAGEESTYFYRYQPYPRFRMERIPLGASPIFSPNFPNMQGHPLVVMPDQWLPRSILYKDRRSGKQTLAGSVGRFIYVLAWRLNATLKLAPAVTPGRFLRSSTLRELGDKLGIDVSASISMQEKGDQLHRSSYPLEMTHICLMIPMAQPIPLRDIYRYINSPYNILLAVSIVYAYGLVLCLLQRLNGEAAHLEDFLLNDRALLGILGQSFRLPCPASNRWIYLMLGIVGLNVNSIFEAALETMMAHPPRQFQARSFADLQRTRLPLVTTEEDLHTVIDMHLNLLVLNVSEYHEVRSSGNSSSAYFASRLHWTLFSEQQKRFSRELFIYSMDACMWSLALMSFQWPGASWFIEPVSKLILEVRANGLYQYWVGMHHYDMTEAGLAGIDDPIAQYIQQKAILRLDDLQWVWLAYGVLVTASTMIFLLEIIWKGLKIKLSFNL
ncbi:hypothetical protein KR074_006420 [Drosophila pseudoananassae]|nr:hypothetical protein KR074_006420 [Drosophila pseudoananassae]